MDSEKYIGLDVHQATIVVAVTDSTGKLVMESILETEAATILQFFAGLRGTLLVTFEEGTWSAWLYDLLNPHVDKLVVCNPRKNALLKDGNKSDRIDARKLAELLRGNQLKPVYHGETGVRMLRELSRSYLTICKRSEGSPIGMLGGWLLRGAAARLKSAGGLPIRIAMACSNCARCTVTSVFCTVVVSNWVCACATSDLGATPPLKRPSVSWRLSV